MVAGIIFLMYQMTPNRHILHKRWNRKELLQHLFRVCMFGYSFDSFRSLFPAKELVITPNQYRESYSSRARTCRHRDTHGQRRLQSYLWYRLQADKMWCPTHALIWPNLLPSPVRMFLINYFAPHQQEVSQFSLPCLSLLLSNHVKQSRKVRICVLIIWFSLTFPIDWWSRYAFVSSAYEEFLETYTLRGLVGCCSSYFTDCTEKLKPRSPRVWRNLTFIDFL